MNLSQLNNVAVLGLGTMGHGIAQVFAMAGYQVRCYDMHPGIRDGVLQRIRGNLDELVAADVVRQDSVDETLSRITVVDDESMAVEAAEFVTEAVAEELPVKQEMLVRLESYVSEDTILASNSSSFTITQSAVHMVRPERAIVTHWFNPPHIIPVVEVVPGESTSQGTTEVTMQLLRKCRKQAVHLKKEIPGFLVNRVQIAMYREIWDLLDQGVASADEIDAAIRGSMGMRLAAIGPLKVHDFAGIDIALQTYEALIKHMRSNQEIPPLVRQLTDEGHYGAKTGRGFYEYTPESLKADFNVRDQRYLQLIKLLYDGSQDESA